MPTARIGALRNTRRPPGLRRLYVVGGCSMLGVLLGTLCPWLDSGQVSRNLYASISAAQHLGQLPVDWELGRIAPLLAPACLVPVALVLVRLPRLAAATAAVVAGFALAAAVMWLTMVDGVPALQVVPAPIGPLITAVSAATVLVVAGLLIRRRRSAQPLRRR